MSRVRVRIPALRAERRLSQRQLAALAGLRPDTVSALERGESAGIRFDTLARLCVAQTSPLPPGGRGVAREAGRGEGRSSGQPRNPG
ncbi:MAG: helix-turn-helix domain-containing protein [Chloroflexi bacterium]|nr:helix-turn-helix domain-containing protein [Chloroflexota bacterium]